MDIRSPIITPVTTPPRPANIAVFAVGAVLDAVVQEKLSNQRYLLKLAPDGASLTANSTANLTPGQPLKLEVMKTGTTPELRIVPADSRTIPGASPESVLHQTLRVLLPRQIGLDELAGALLAQTDRALPAPVREALAELLARLPDTGVLTKPEGMRQAVQDSGVLFEARILQALETGADFPEQDLKGKLLQLLDKLQSPPLQANAEQAKAGLTQAFQAADLELLAHKVEGALARITLDQLASLPQPDGSQLWRMEIPFGTGQEGDAAKLLIASEEREGKAGGRSWSITLELQPPGLGSFCARILWNGARIDTYLWSDRPETLERMRENTETLRARLQQAGLVVGHLAALERAPAREKTETAAVPLLDLRA